MPGDYDGDGTVDIAIFRESTGLWAVDGGARYYFGGVGDVPLPGIPASVGGSPWQRSVATSDLYYLAGNIGIGVANPSAPLMISEDSTTTFPQMMLYEQGTNDYARLTFRLAASSDFFTIAGMPKNTTTDARMHIYYNETGNLMSFTGDGKVGIGTDNPTGLLQVSSDTTKVGLKVSGGVASGSGYSIAEFYDGNGALEFFFHGDGTGYANTSWVAFSPYISMQFIPDEMEQTDYETGDLVAVINGKAVKTRRAFDTAVVGVICPPEGFVSTPHELKHEIMDKGKSRDDFNLVSVAYQGDVMIKINDEGGKISSGDLIVPSSVPGVGMRGKLDTIDQYAAVIGKARQDFDGTEGLIPVAVGVK